MRLLHIISSMNPRGGGPCQSVRNLTPCTISRGHSVEVICLDDPASEYLSGENLSLHAVGRGRTGWSYHPALRPWLEKNLRRFDAVILNGLWQYPGYLLSRLAMDPKMPPYFIFPHGMLDPWFQQATGRRLKAVRNWVYWKLIENRVISNARAMLFTCQEEMRLANQSFTPYRPKLQINVGLGIVKPPAFNARMARAFSQKCPRLQNKPYILFLGRIHPKKGIDIMLQGYAEIYRRSQINHTGLGNDFPRLVIAGPGEETTYGKEMLKLSSSLGLEDTVIWPEMLTGDAKWGGLYSATAFILTSHQENFGIAVAESLACGTPVMVSDQVNIWREIQQDGAGLVAAATKEGAADLFQRWRQLSSDALRSMRESARHCFQKRFDVDVSAQTFLKTLECLGRQPGSPRNHDREFSVIAE
jgi:glycosyltransferase involved in cell wall biosynthesis